MYPWKFSKNPITGSQDIVQTRKCDANANMDAKGICTKSNMFPPWAGKIFTHHISNFVTYFYIYP